MSIVTWIYWGGIWAFDNDVEKHIMLQGLLMNWNTFLDSHGCVKDFLWISNLPIRNQLWCFHISYLKYGKINACMWTVQGQEEGGNGKGLSQQSFIPWCLSQFDCLCMKLLGNITESIFNFGSQGIQLYPIDALYVCKWFSRTWCLLQCLTVNVWALEMLGTIRKSIFNPGCEGFQ